MFSRHRQAFLDHMQEGDLALFPGAELVTRNHDVEFPFRQHSDFWYLTGLREPAGMLMLATTARCDGPCWVGFWQVGRSPAHQ